MWLKNFFMAWLCAASMIAEAQTIVTEANIKAAFKSAVEEKRLTEKSFIWINHADKPYDKCMDYDFFVQWHRVTLYYCLDYADKVVIERDNFKSWTQEQRKILYDNLTSPFPVLK